MYHIAMLVSDSQLHALKERKSKGDKFISNIYRTKIDHQILLKPPPTNKFVELEELI